MIAECAWEINCVLVALDGTDLLMYEPSELRTIGHQVRLTVQNGSAELSLEEAKELVKSLQKAIEQYEHLEEGMKDL